MKRREQGLGGHPTMFLMTVVQPRILTLILTNDDGGFVFTDVPSTEVQRQLHERGFTKSNNDKKRAGGIPGMRAIILWHDKSPDRMTTLTAKIAADAAAQAAPPPVEEKDLSFLFHQLKATSVGAFDSVKAAIETAGSEAASKLEGTSEQLRAWIQPSSVGMPAVQLDSSASKFRDAVANAKLSFSKGATIAERQGRNMLAGLNKVVESSPSSSVHTVTPATIRRNQLDRIEQQRAKSMRMVQGTPQYRALQEEETRRAKAAAALEEEV